MTREIQPADAGLRLRMLALLAALAALGAAGIFFLDRHLRALQDLAATSHPLAAEHAMAAVWWVLALVLAGAAALALLLVRGAWQTLRAGRYPPPGARVWTDTAVLRGNAARRRGVAALVLAAVIFLAAVATVLVAHRTFRLLLDPRLKPTPVNVTAAPTATSLAQRIQA